MGASVGGSSEASVGTKVAKSMVIGGWSIGDTNASGTLFARTGFDVRPRASLDVQQIEYKHIRDAHENKGGQCGDEESRKFLPTKLFHRTPFSLTHLPVKVNLAFLGRQCPCNAFTCQFNKFLR